MSSASLPPTYAAARDGAAVLPRPRGRIVVSGKDRATYLQGLLTNDVVALGAGQGCYSAYLTPQGRMMADLWVYELGDVILLSMSPAVKDAVLAKLDQFIFSEDVQLGDVSDTFGAVAIVGPRSAQAAATALGIDASVLAGLPEHGNVRVTHDGEPAIALRITDAGEPGYELLVPRERSALLDAAVRAAGAAALDEATADVLRIEGGVPLFGRDMDEDTIPLEAGIESRAISFTKGCYVGQEVIIRVLHRGHGRVARKLVGLTFDGGVAEPGTALQIDGKDIGTITSSAMSPALGRGIALGYVKRDFAAPGTRITSAQGLQAEVVALPFVQRGETPTR
jgi:folate-binding protein YgfZ